VRGSFSANLILGLGPTSVVVISGVTPSEDVPARPRTALRASSTNSKSDSLPCRPPQPGKRVARFHPTLRASALSGRDLMSILVRPCDRPGVIVRTCGISGGFSPLDTIIRFSPPPRDPPPLPSPTPPMCASDFRNLHCAFRKCLKTRPGTLRFRACADTWWFAKPVILVVKMRISKNLIHD